MEHQMIINDLRGLDLKSVPLEVVRTMLRKFEKFGVVITKLPAGKKIIRARLSEAHSFENISQLSYKPQAFNATFQRASTPERTMFYGSIVPEKIGNTEPPSARYTILFEISEFVRDLYTIGEQEITFSAWEITEEIELVSVIHHKNFARPTRLSLDLQDRFEKKFKNDTPQKLASLEISNFLGEEFAKDPIRHNTDYTLSATYSELVTKQYDGVLYPSVRLAGEGINVAIKPETIEKKIRFLGASECTIYKSGKAVFVGGNTKAVILPGEKIKFIPESIQFAVSKEMGRRQVGLI
jgi:hypothetical protein